MSYNDSEELHHLLVWINREREEINENIAIYSLDQLQQSKLIYYTLSKIDLNFFYELSQSDFEFMRYFSKIESYLHEMQGKRFKRAFKIKVVEENLLSELIKVILFLIVNSNAKIDYVNRICEFDEETQKYLMMQLQKVESQIENVMEVKQILNKVEELQEENELLIQELRDITNKNAKLLQIAEGIQEQQNKLQEESKKNKLQKNQILEDLNICEVKDYLTIYRDLELQNKALQLEYQDKQKQSAGLMEENEELKQKIVEDDMIIVHLNEQIAKYKFMHKEIQQEISFYDEKVNKENMRRSQTQSHSHSILNSKLRISFEANNNSFNSIDNYNILDQDDFAQNEKIRQYNNELMAKLEEMYKKMNSLSQQAATLKDSNLHYIKKNRHNDKKLRALKEAHEIFTKEYEFTMIW